MVRTGPVLPIALALVLSTSCAEDKSDSHRDSDTSQSTAQVRSSRIAQIETGLLGSGNATDHAEPAGHLVDLMQDRQVPGLSVAIVDNNAIDWSNGYGVIESEASRPVDTETLFQVGRLSEAVIAAATLRLVDEGVLTLDEDVDTRLRRYEIGSNASTAISKITLRQLLSHSAGISSMTVPGYEPNEKLPSLRHILYGIYPSKTKPIRVGVTRGQRQDRSSGSYLIVQQLLVDVAEQPFPDLVDAILFQPARMSRSTIKQPLPERDVVNAARGHDSRGSVVPGRWRTYPELAVAGLWSTAEDLARFAIEVSRASTGESTRLLSQRSAAMIVTSDQESEGEDGFGSGFATSGRGPWRSVHRFGSTVGYRSLVLFYPEQGKGAVILVNSANGTELGLLLLRRIGRAYGWRDLDRAIPEEIPVR